MKWSWPLLKRGELRRLLVLVVVAGLCAAIVTDWASVPSVELHAGDVAPGTVRAPVTYTFQDFEGHERRQEEAKTQVPPVFSYRPEIADELRIRVATAFAVGRERLREASADGAPLNPASREAIFDAVRVELGVQIPSEDIGSLVDSGFPADAQSLANTLLATAMQSLIVKDRAVFPNQARAVQLVELRGLESFERQVTDLDQFMTPSEARQRVSLAYLEGQKTTASGDAAATIARALVRPNVTPEETETQDRQTAAASAVPIRVETVKRGAILFRQGDVLTEAQAVRYEQLLSARGEHGPLRKIGAVALLFLISFGSLFQFGASYLPRFRRDARSAYAFGGLLVLEALLTKTFVVAADPIAEVLGHEAHATSVWFAAPLAGPILAASLVLGTSAALLLAASTAILAAVAMDLQALHLVWFLIIGVVAAGANDQTRERLALVRAGLFVGVVGCVAVLAVHFVQLFVVEAEVSLAATMRPVWSMSFAFVGAISSSFLALGLVPLFESAGFVTDFRLMELASLNHPLLRNLMLRAPGSYHHSVMVGTLAEAASEAIGANALEAKVCAYFHDVGKTLKPQYFVENQRDGVNRHNLLEPTESAQIIIEHVVEGARMAREHRLPKPIIDNILMHHGDGLLLYFLAKGRETNPNVDESLFRYPGPKPNTREAGIIMLADKVEAATRTIKVPTEGNIRAMINRILNSVISDGQFDECPLTFPELRATVDTFVSVLLGIYHQRIEYPQTRAVSSAAGDANNEPSGAVITLDLPPTARRGKVLQHGSDVGPVDDETDYEAPRHLPRAE